MTFNKCICNAIKLRKCTIIYFELKWVRQLYIYIFKFTPCCNKYMRSKVFFWTRGAAPHHLGILVNVLSACCDVIKLMCSHIYTNIYLRKNPCISTRRYIYVQLCIYTCKAQTLSISIFLPIYNILSICVCMCVMASFMVSIHLYQIRRCSRLPRARDSSSNRIAQIHISYNVFLWWVGAICFVL